MYSIDLESEGFSSWYTFTTGNEHSLIAALPKAPGIYVIRSPQSFARTIGESDICYVGSAANSNGLKGRIRQYFHPGPTQSTNWRVLSFLKQSGNLELAFLVCSGIGEAKKMEKVILSKYISEHGELPLLNRRQ